MPLPSVPLRLSQTSLMLLSACPRKFQYLYLDQLAVPLDSADQERLTQGSQFHLVMQQWQLGLPIAALLEANPPLQAWFSSFQSAAPEILSLPDPTETIHTQSEQIRTWEMQGYLFTVVYDLLLTGSRHAKILDWKTYPRPQHSAGLQQHWQTRLYPFVLAETSGYPPEAISMVYWFFQSADRADQPALPQSLMIAYSAVQHDRTRQDLTRLLDSLTQWLQDYDQGQPFPQVRDRSPCQNCSFALRCDRQEPALPPAIDSLPCLDDIAELTL